MASVRQMSCHVMLKFGMCQKGLASVRQIVTVWHVSMASVRQMSQGLACVNGVCASDVSGFDMCQWRLCVSDVTGLACAMASVRQMSQVWHVPMASIDMSQVFVTHATMLRDTSGFQWHMPKTCDINL